MTETRKDPRPGLARYGAALAAVGAAFAVTYLAQEPLGRRVPFAFFYAAVVVATFYGGLRVGLLAVAASAALADYFFLPPQSALTLDPVGLLQIAVFLFVSLLVCVMIERSKRAEAGRERLRESEYAARRASDEARAATAGILESVTDGFFAFDRDWRFTYVNSEGARTLGRPAAELIGKNLWQEFPELTETSFGRLYRRAADENRKLELEDYYPPLDAWFHARAYPNESGLSVYFHDVTVRRRADEMRAHLAAIVESSDDVIIGKTLEGTIMSWNKAAERTYGYTAEEVVGRSVSILFPPDRPDELPQIMGRLRRGERIDHYETERVTKGGERIIVSLTISPIRGPDGVIIGASTIARDITEMKRVQAEREQLLAREREARSAAEESELRYRSLARATSQMVWVTDADGMIEDMPEWRSLTGQTAEEVRGRGWLDAIHPEDRERVARVWDAAFSSRAIYDVEYRIRSAAGGYRQVTVRGVPVVGAEGRVKEWIGTLTDVTEEKRAAARLREQAEVIETVNRTGQMIAGELDVQKVIQSVTDAATELSGARFGAFFYNVLDEHGASYMLYTLSGVPRSAFAHFPMPRATDLFGPTFRGEGTILIPDVVKDARYGKNSPYYGMPEGHLPVVSYLAVPVISRSGEVLGGLFFGHPEAAVFTERAARIIEGLAAQAAVALDNARLFEAAARERRKAEASEEHYRFLAESIPQIVWTSDADGRPDYYNQRWYEYTGIAPGEVTDFGNSGAVHTEDLAAARGRWAEASAAGATFESELRIRRGSDGSYRWHLARAVPLRDHGGRIVKWFGTSTDIDDRKQAEESQRFLAQASEVLVSSLDYEATLARLARLVVPRLADWCSIDMLTEERQIRRLAVAHEDPAKVEFARELEQRYPPSMSDAEGVAKVIRTGEPEIYPNVPDELLALVARDSEHLRILRELGLRSALVVPLAAQGRTIGAITLVAAESGRRYSQADLPFVEDLAHRAALAIENARLYREAQEVNRLKDEFLATLSHELRTPLTAVLGWTRLLGTGQLDAETSRRAMETIERNAQSQVQLIDDILDVSRIIRGKLRLNVRPVELAPVIESAVDSVRPAAEAKGIRLQVVLDRQAGPVSGDPDRLQQVVWNLLSNAIKFTPKDGRVQVLLARVDSQLEVTVSDSGQGIAPEFIPYVFDRFRQADPTTTRTHGGLGLGLAIVRHLVELHGGSVRAESAGAARGATFRVLLPLLAMHPAEPPTSEHPAASASSAAAPASGNGFHLECPPELAGLRVLVVEDDADSRELLIAVLSQCEAEVLAVSRAADALDALDSWRPDVLVSDIEMPGEDGYTLIRKVRARPADRGGQIPAAALTAYARSEDRMRALVAGFQIHVPKPVEPAELVTVIASLAGRAVKS
ncbi:MAG TPA: PAS domain S-box protein [Pyrinomonadaceae bacterium]|nr:PAS domain S-box protein [Pyrinomonadaceae bacterium]